MTDPTMPANDTAGNSDREWLSNLIHDDQREQCDLDPEGFYDCEQLADRILAAGFTRAQHDGETVAALERGRDAANAVVKWRQEQADILTAEKNKARAERDALADQIEPLRAAIGYSRKILVDAGLDGAAPIEALARGAAKLIAERDALAAKLAERDGDVRRLEAAVVANAGNPEAGNGARHLIALIHARANERDAAVARAEQAEAKLAAHQTEPDPNDPDGWIRRSALNHWSERGTKAESRAAALAEALRELVSCKDLHDRIENHPTGTIACDAAFKSAKDEYAQRKPLAWAAARAALAGNGDGGEGRKSSASVTGRLPAHGSLRKLPNGAVRGRRLPDLGRRRRDASRRMPRTAERGGDASC